MLIFSLTQGDVWFYRIRGQECGRSAEIEKLVIKGGCSNRWQLLHSNDNFRNDYFTLRYNQADNLCEAYRFFGGSGRNII